MLWDSAPVMRIFVSFRFSALFALILLALAASSVVFPQCLDHQRSLLLQLKGSLIYNSSLSTKLVYWNQNEDCCLWNGVTCDLSGGGHIIGLDLSNESITGGIDNCTALFSFEFLENLTLSNNLFSNIEIPSSFNNLTSLMNLNLSNTGFAGQVPSLLNLSRLTVLDLSCIYFPGIPPLKLANPNLAMLVQNLKNLTDLYLDGVSISDKGSEWCRAVSSSLPNLTILSLSNCNLSGPIDSSLAKLHHLSEIRLNQNKLSSSVPEFLATLTNLKALRLGSCNLTGNFPSKIIKVPTLSVLDLSDNRMLHGALPEFLPNGGGSLETLILSRTNFSGRIPSSIDHLVKLSKIQLAVCDFSGRIPTTIGNLSNLVYLDLSYNMFTGPIPSFRKSKSLTYIDLSHNNLTGQVSHDSFEGFPNLTFIDLNSNSFSGGIPPSLFELPSLREVFLSNNSFNSLPGRVRNLSSSLLSIVDLSENQLGGADPSYLFELKRLDVLSIAFNNFTGALQLEKIQRPNNLSSLDLSYSGLSINGSDSSNAGLFWSSFSQLTTLKLASCYLTSFPDLRNQSRLSRLDLSDNQIVGKIPNWIWNMSIVLKEVDLSSNQLVDLEKPYSMPFLRYLDLHSNNLSGQIPIPPRTALVVDYSNNSFTSPISIEIGSNLSSALFFSASNNQLTGTIPESICRVRNLQFLDLSGNHLEGVVPQCLHNLSKTLSVLNLGRNDLVGNISETYWNYCSLKSLDLNGNRLGGKVPKFLQNCSELEVLNLGNNQINDIFPCFLKDSAKLRILILRSNKFYGSLKCPAGNEATWPKLQIIDIFGNSFTGELPTKWFWNGKGTDESMREQDFLRVEHLLPPILKVSVLPLTGVYYQAKVTVTLKGIDMELERILFFLSSIDFSSNNFEGFIPDTLGTLESLHVLNLSHNCFRGPIPPSIGRLKQVESLDLSNNNLSGAIPKELRNLNFLSHLNLSHNQLVGMIPTGEQLGTFDYTSYESNKGLCGFPLSRSCSNDQEAIAPAENVKESALSFKINLLFVCIGVGYGMGAATIVVALLFWKRGRRGHDKLIGVLHVMTLAVVGFIYASCCEKAVVKIQIEEKDEYDGGGAEEEEKAFDRISYCVFCTRLDRDGKKAIHSMNCSCHGHGSSSSVSYSSSSLASSSHCS